MGKFNYRVKHREEDTKIEASLTEGGDGTLNLRIGDYNVLAISPDGLLYIYAGIPKDRVVETMSGTIKIKYPPFLKDAQERYCGGTD